MAIKSRRKYKMTEEEIRHNEEILEELERVEASDKYIYHRVPKKVYGDKLIPLNQLKDEFPNLDCLWNDVLHFSPIDPLIIFNVLKDIGFDYEMPQHYRLPVRILRKKEAVYYKYPKDRERFQGINNEDYPLFNKEKFIELEVVPEFTINYYKDCYSKDCYSKGNHPLLFHGIDHVLVKSDIYIGQMENI